MKCAMRDSGTWGGAKQLWEMDNTWRRFNNNEGWRKTRTTEKQKSKRYRGCSKSLKKPHKRRMQQFGDVNGSQAWCKQGICYQILSVINFKLLTYSLFQYFCSPKNRVGWYPRCYVLSSLRHLGVNTRKLKLKFWTLVHIFISTPKCIGKTKELALLFNTFGGDCISCLGAMSTVREFESESVSQSAFHILDAHTLWLLSMWTGSWIS